MADAPFRPVLEQLYRQAGAAEVASCTDRQLLERFTWRDEAAFETLVRRHVPMVLGVCRRLLTNDADAEDAFQATFLVLVRKAGWPVRPRARGRLAARRRLPHGPRVSRPPGLEGPSRETGRAVAGAASPRTWRRRTTGGHCSTRK